MATTVTQSEAIESAVHDTHAHLMAYAQGHVNDDLVACMFASWRSGVGALPDWMGLSQEDFEKMMQHHFPGAPYEERPEGLVAPLERFDEIDEIHRLLMMHRANQSESEIWVATIVALGCMGSDHLWQDLGLWSRPDLTDLMHRNFPTLLNEKNMKWKKYLYKQLCESEGIYTCRSPSCEVCADYANCFGPED
jgi:nitrogen fixation protein NifQ